MHKLKRLISFLIGLIVFLGIGALALMVFDIPQLSDIQRQLSGYEWFEPTLYILTALIVFIALIFLLFAFSTSYKKRGIYERFEDGDIYITKQTIENHVKQAIEKYDDVRQPTVAVKLHQRSKDSYLDIMIDMLVTRPDTQVLFEQMYSDIKASTEQFAEMPVRHLKFQPIDQKELRRRVI